MFRDIRYIVWSKFPTAWPKFELRFKRTQITSNKARLTRSVAAVQLPTDSADMFLKLNILTLLYVKIKNHKPDSLPNKSA
jgi:hypothetical protein